MITTAVITAITDRYDTVKPILPQDDVDVDWVFVTDDEEMATHAETFGWRAVLQPTSEHPNRAAKQPKMCPWRYTTAPESVWIDGSFRITSSRFVTEVMTLANPIAQFAHPWRDCVYEEGKETLQLVKYSTEYELVHQQLETYRHQRHPEHWGLWAAGVIARRHTVAVQQLGIQWLRECALGSYQDQISEAPTLRMLGLRPTTIPGTHLANAWLSYEGSGRHG